MVVIVHEIKTLKDKKIYKPDRVLRKKSLPSIIPLNSTSKRITRLPKLKSSFVIKSKNFYNQNHIKSSHAKWHVFLRFPIFLSLLLQFSILSSHWLFMEFDWKLKQIKCLSQASL